MIFVTYGTQPHNFKHMGEVVNQINPDIHVVAQIGESTNNIVRPNTQVYDYITDYQQYVVDSEMIITHGGVGSIMGGLQAGKKVIVIPRLADFGEHIDNHQLEITTKLAKGNHIYYMQRNEDINQVIVTVRATDFAPYQSNTQNFVSNIEKILRGDK